MGKREEKVYAHTHTQFFPVYNVFGFDVNASVQTQAVEIEGGKTDYHYEWRIN